jgi:Flp pilus assembly protein TadG
MQEVGANEQGQSLVEFALSLAVVVVILLGILDLGRAIFVNTMLSAAAQAGARSGSITANTTLIEESVRQQLNGIDRNAVTIQIVPTDNHTEVLLSYDFVPVTPLIGGLLPNNNLQLAQSARMMHLGVTIPGASVAGASFP